jgi:hypothetical protein
MTDWLKDCYLNCFCKGRKKKKSKIFLSTPRYAAYRRVATPSSNLIEYLRECESICKTVLAHESGDPGVQFNENTEGENLVRLSL